MMWQDRSAVAVAEQKRWQDGSLCSVAKTLRSYDLLSFCQSKQIQGLQANKRDFAMISLYIMLLVAVLASGQSRLGLLHL